MNRQINIIKGLSSFLNIIQFLLSKNFDELIVKESKTYGLNSFWNVRGFKIKWKKSLAKCILDFILPKMFE